MVFGPWDPDGLERMTLVLVSSNAQDPGRDRHGTTWTPISWQEDGPWGTTYLAPFQKTVSLRFGTGQKDNVNIWTRPRPIGDAFSLTVAIKDRPTERLFVNGRLAMTYTGKRPEMANNVSTGWLGRGRADTWFDGDIAEVLVYAKALSEDERDDLERYLVRKYFGGSFSDAGF